MQDFVSVKSVMILTKLLCKKEKKNGRKSMGKQYVNYNYEKYKRKKENEI